MLTQMERFDGLFICSTNLMQRLDTASLRRFALKIKFDYLKPEQRWQLFLAQAKKFSRSHEAEYRAALNQLNNLTPGDFATVRRQVRLLNVVLTANELLNRLRQVQEQGRQRKSTDRLCSRPAITRIAQRDSEQVSPPHPPHPPQQP